MDVTQECDPPISQSPLNRASKDKFLMELNLPHVLRNESKTDPSLEITSLQVNVFGTVVPTISVPSTEVRYGGQSTHVSSYSRPAYSPLRVTFAVDNRFKNYYILWRWLDVLNDSVESVYSGTPRIKQSKELGDQTEYQTNISIFALDEYNERIIQFLYYDCFITSLNEINYSYRDGEIIEATAEFQFNQLKIFKVKK